MHQSGSKARLFLSFVVQIVPYINYSRESEGICFTGVGLSVCLSVTTITKPIVDGFLPHFMGRFLRGKGRPSLCFVTIGRRMWK